MGACGTKTSTVNVISALFFPSKRHMTTPALLVSATSILARPRAYLNLIVTNPAQVFQRPSPLRGQQPQITIPDLECCAVPPHGLSAESFFPLWHGALLEYCEAQASIFYRPAFQIECVHVRLRDFEGCVPRSR